MASSSTSADKTSFHTRSISLPSRAHLQITSLEDQLSRLRSSTTASTSSSSSSSSVCQNLGLLNDLYQSFDDFLQLQHSQQYCPQQVEKSLDGSVKLLDICSMTKEALLIAKESLQNLESSLRRRRTGSSESSVLLQNFQDSRKNVKRIVSRCSKNLSKMEIQLGKNNDLLEEVEAASLPIIQSILSFVYGSEATKSSSLLSKLITISSSKQTRKQGEVMEKMDQALEVLKGKKKNTEETLELQSVELTIQELEEGLDCLFRRLLKSRVSLLNLLNH